MSYADEVTKAMAYLASHPKTVFVGQAVEYDGQRLHATLRDVPKEKRIEMPVCEDFQMGFCSGLALEGYIPISIYPRWDFLILAANQLVNHLDKLPMFGYQPKVIVRTAVGAKSPLDPGPQHAGNYSCQFRTMLKTMQLMEIEEANMVQEVYEKALNCERSVVVVEYMEKYK